jgi:hypothetical protein
VTSDLPSVTSDLPSVTVGTKFTNIMFGMKPSSIFQANIRLDSQLTVHNQTVKRRDSQVTSVFLSRQQRDCSTSYSVVTKREVCTLLGDGKYICLLIIKASSLCSKLLFAISEATPDI